MTLKLITFDLDDTLWPVEPVLRRAEQVSYDWLRQQHPEIAARHSLSELMSLRAAVLREQPALQHNLTALRKAALQKMFTAAGYQDAEARQQSEIAFRIFHDARNQVELFPHTREMLEALAQHYVLGALTNGNADLKRIGLGDLFAFQHSAESVGRRKPAADIFHAAHKSVSARPNQTLHIGDHPHEDVQAAREHGWHTAWANLLQREWPQQFDSPRYIMDSWQSLPDIVERINGGD